MQWGGGGVLFIVTKIRHMFNKTRILQYVSVICVLLKCSYLKYSKGRYHD